MSESDCELQTVMRLHRWKVRIVTTAADDYGVTVAANYGNINTIKHWGTEVSPYQSTHEPPFEMNAAEVCADFLPTMADIKFCEKVSSMGL